MKNDLSNTAAFTLMELLVTIIIIGIMVSFAVPNFRNTMERNHRRDAEAQLIALHGANNIYRAQTRGFWVQNTSNINTINSGLNINLVSNGMNYSYNGNATAFTATAVRQSPAPTFTITINQNTVDATNPSCSGTCP